MRFFAPEIRTAPTERSRALLRTIELDYNSCCRKCCRMRRFQTLVLFAGLFFLPLRGNAATIFSNVGPGNSLTSPGIGIGFIPFTSTFNYAGIAFTPIGQSYSLDSIELSLQLSSGPNVADVFVTRDVGGLPSGISNPFTFPVLYRSDLLLLSL
jgi:hypothetical protein